jgi:hypothetical protein
VDGKALDWRANDELRVDGPKEEGGVIDCTDPAACSLGLATDADVAFSNVEGHSATRALGALRVNTVLVGKSRRAWAGFRTTNHDVIVQGFARLFGLKAKRAGGITLFASAAVVDGLQPKRVPGTNRKIDLQLVGVELANVTRLMSDVSKQTISGDVRGQLSVWVRNVDSQAFAGLYFAACGIKAERRGADVMLMQGENVCGDYQVPAARCPATQVTAQRSAESRLACFPIAELHVAGVGLPKRGDHFVMLAHGPPNGDEIVLREGDMPNPPEEVRVGDRVLLVNWRVSTIERERVVLELDTLEPGQKARTLELRAAAKE